MNVLDHVQHYPATAASFLNTDTSGYTDVAGYPRALSFACPSSRKVCLVQTAMCDAIDTPGRLYWAVRGTGGSGADNVVLDSRRLAACDSHAAVLRPQCRSIIDLAALGIAVGQTITWTWATKPSTSGGGTVYWGRGISDEGDGAATMYVQDAPSTSLIAYASYNPSTPTAVIPPISPTEVYTDIDSLTASALNVSFNSGAYSGAWIILSAIGDEGNVAGNQGKTMWALRGTDGEATQNVVMDTNFMAFCDPTTNPNVIRVRSTTPAYHALTPATAYSWTWAVARHGITGGHPLRCGQDTSPPEGYGPLTMEVWGVA